MNRKTLVIILAIVVIAIVGALIYSTAKQGGQSGDLTRPATDFTLTDQFGKEHTISEYEGKVVFLNFWATWCPPCGRELPDFQKTYEEYGKNEKDVIILGIAAPGYGGEGTAEEVAAFFKESGCDYPVLMDEEAGVFAEYAISGLPTTVMIDKNGKEVTRNTGQMDAHELGTMIERVLDRE